MVQRVIDPINSALRNGKGKKGPYEAEYDRNTNSLRLYHYGTLIYEDRDSRLVRLGGWSRSDQAAISTAMALRLPGVVRVSRAVRSPWPDAHEVNGWWVR